jgi:Kef-type K+ transport system membrane component KefB
MPELKLLFLQITVILVVSRSLAAVSRFARQPEVVGEMVAGILLGPSVLGAISPAAMQGLFPPTSLGPLYALSQLGLVLFLFLVGLDVRRPDGLSVKAVIITSYASIAAPFLCGGILAWHLYSRLGNGTSRLSFVLFLGAAMSITAFPVLARILGDRKLMNTRVGMFAISCAVVDDVTAWSLLAIITFVARGEANLASVTLRFAGLAVYVLGMLFLVRAMLRRFVPTNSTISPGWFAAAMVFLLASVSATEALGVHALFGAFLAGVVMPRGGRLEAEFRGHLKSVTLVLLLPLFFAYTGLRTSFELLASANNWLLSGLILLVAVASKFLVSAACCRVSGMPWRESLAIGALVNTRGLVELVILNVGLDLHILSPTLFTMMVIMALTTTLMTGPVIDRLLPSPSSHPRRRVRWSSRVTAAVRLIGDVFLSYVTSQMRVRYPRNPLTRWMRWLTLSGGS